MTTSNWRSAIMSFYLVNLDYALPTVGAGLIWGQSNCTASCIQRYSSDHVLGGRPAPTVGGYWADKSEIKSTSFNRQSLRWADDHAQVTEDTLLLNHLKLLWFQYQRLIGADRHAEAAFRAGFVIDGKFAGSHGTCPAVLRPDRDIHCHLEIPNSTDVRNC